MVGLLCGVWSSGCCGLGVGSSGYGLPLLANLLLLVLKELLVACPPGRVSCFGLTEDAGPVAAATLGGDVCTTILGEGCGLVLLMVGECSVLGWWRLGMLCVSQVGNVGCK